MANSEQLLAANPANSSWVSASAGTGKTKILTDRVLRLLLQQVEPKQILCLTFTKAAANEMDNRINYELSTWSRLNGQALKDSLQRILGRPPSQSELEIAPTLFTTKLDSPESIKIQTIHAFCQFILKKFPIEANISPSFKVIDEFKADEILLEIRHKLLSYTASSQNQIQESLEFVASHFHESTIFNIIKDLISKRNRFQNLFERFDNSEQYSTYLRNKFKLKNFTYPQDIFNDLWQQIPKNTISNINEANEKELELIANFNNLIINTELNFEDRYQNFKNLFLTQKSEPRKTLFLKKFREKHPDIEDNMRQIQQIILEAEEKLRSLNLVFFTSKLFNIAKHIINEYQLYKNKYGFLDYDDLIYKTMQLLNSSYSSDWIRYKLDGGIEHILVDEAQDTSQEQWYIIKALIEDFFSGVSNKEKERTLFVVGDAKQSIYSFQGASPFIFKAMNNFFEQKITSAQQKFEQIELSWSYRSNQTIIDTVSIIFDYINKNHLSNEDIFKVTTQCFRQNIPGKLSVLPLIKQEEPELENWPIPKCREQKPNNAELLAKIIAKYVHDEIATQRIIPATQEPIKAGDFLILVRRRNIFTNKVIEELKNLKIPIAGIDRMLLIDNLSIQDLMAMAKFVLLPEDDLNLAGLLKSPLIGLNEKELYDLLVDRHKSKIWEILQHKQNCEYKEALNILNNFRQLYLRFPFDQFFSIVIDGLNYRENLLVANGNDSGEAIDEFLNLTQNYANYNNANLQEFILWFTKANIEIKREVEAGQSLRVMTVHGSKGLQAPIVILADTTSLPQNTEKMLWDEEGDLLWPAYLDNYNSAYQKLSESAAKHQYDEYLRLLYVALTRAEDELVVCGYNTKSATPANCWYDLITSAMGAKLTYKPIDQHPSFGGFFGPQEKIALFGNFDNDYSIKRDLPSQSQNPYNIIVDSKDNEIASCPDIKVLQPEKNSITTKSPLDSKLKSTDYGIIIHKILEDYIYNFDLNVITKHYLLNDLSPSKKLLTIENLQKLVTSALFGNLLSDAIEVIPEISLGQLEPSSKGAIFRLDLLIKKKNEVIIIDYKTDYRFSSTDPVPEGYIKQLRNYKKLAANIYPYYNIRSLILWIHDQTSFEVT